MTRDEFGRILSTHFLVYYPDTKIWVSSLDEPTREAWAGLFETIEGRDLISVLSKIVHGQLEVPSRDRLATTLKFLARRQQYEREQKQALASERAKNRKNRRGEGVKSGFLDVMNRAGLLDVYKLQVRTVQLLVHEMKAEKDKPMRAYIAQIVGAATAHWFGLGHSVAQMQKNAASFGEIETVALEAGRAVPGERIRSVDDYRDLIRAV